MYNLASDWITQAPKTCNPDNPSGRPPGGRLLKLILIFHQFNNWELRCTSDVVGFAQTANGGYTCAGSESLPTSWLKWIISGGEVTSHQQEMVNRFLSRDEPLESCTSLLSRPWSLFISIKWSVQTNDVVRRMFSQRCWAWRLDWKMGQNKDLMVGVMWET